MVNSHVRREHTPVLYILSFCLPIRGQELTQSSILWSRDEILSLLCGTSKIRLRNLTGSDAKGIFRPSISK